MQLRSCEDSSRVPGMQPSKKAWCSRRVCASLVLLMKLPSAFFRRTHTVTGGGATNSLGLRVEKMISHGQGLQSDFTTGMQEANTGLQSSRRPVEQSVLWAVPTLRPSLPWDRQSHDVNHGVSSSVCLMRVLLQSHIPPKVAPLYACRGCTPVCSFCAYFSPDAMHLCFSFFSLTVFDY